MEENKVLYLCDMKKCENCSIECNHTSDITHAINFIRKQRYDGEYYFLEDGGDNYKSHKHLCEIDLFNRKNKSVWKKECLYKRKQKNSGWCDKCDECKHLIIVNFKDENEVEASDIIRFDN